MVKQLLQEAEREIWPTSQERKYLRLGRDGKVFYITEAEAMEEEVLAGPRKKLSLEEMLGDEWNCRVEWANQLKERISFVHQMMRDDDQRPSRYEPVYNTLWDEYRDAIESLRDLDREPVDQFRDKVVGRLKEMVVKLNTMCDNWNPDLFNSYEQMLICHEKNLDLMAALQKVA